MFVDLPLSSITSFLLFPSLCSAINVVTFLHKMSYFIIIKEKVVFLKIVLVLKEIFFNISRNVIESLRNNDVNVGASTSCVRNRPNTSSIKYIRRQLINQSFVTVTAFKGCSRTYRFATRKSTVYHDDFFMKLRIS